MCYQQSLRSACAYTQSDQSLCLLLEYSMTVKLLTEHHLEFLSLNVGCTGSHESTLVEMSLCWKSHVMAHMYFLICSWKKSTSEQEKMSHFRKKDPVCKKDHFCGCWCSVPLPHLSALCNCDITWSYLSQIFFY